MPFTPFHMGPGAAMKAVSGDHFSLMVFGFSQIIIDIEPLIRILHGDKYLHGYSHTYIGAFIIGLFSIFLGKHTCEWLLRIWNYFFHCQWLRGLQVNPKISWLATTTGAILGTFSHVVLDSIVHDDVKPMLPFNQNNELLYLFPGGWVCLFCLFSGVIGLLALLVIFLWRKWTFDTE
jgi:hypothetical protein